MGNVDFDTQGKVDKKTEAVGIVAAKMFGLPEFAAGDTSLANRLSTDLLSSFAAGGKPSIIEAHCDQRRARGYRDALAKAIYGRLFIKILSGVTRNSRRIPPSTIKSSECWISLVLKFSRRTDSSRCVSTTVTRNPADVQRSFLPEGVERVRSGYRMQAIDPPDNSATVNLWNFETDSVFWIVSVICTTRKMPPIGLG